MVLIAQIFRNLLHLALFVVGAQGEIICGAGTAPNGTDYVSRIRSEKLCVRDLGIVESIKCIQPSMQIPGEVMLAASNLMQPFVIQCTSPDPLNFTVFGNIFADGNVHQTDDNNHQFYAEVKLGPYNDSCDVILGTVEVLTTSEPSINFHFDFLKPPISDTDIFCLVQADYLRSASTVTPICSSNQYCETTIVRNFVQPWNSVRCDTLGEMVITLGSKDQRFGNLFPSIDIYCSAGSPLGISHKGSLLAKKAHFWEKHGQHALLVRLNLEEFNLRETGSAVRDEISFHLLSEPKKSMNISLTLIPSKDFTPVKYNSDKVGIRFYNVGAFLGLGVACCGIRRRAAYFSNIGESNPTLTKFNMGALSKFSNYKYKRVSQKATDFCTTLSLDEIYSHGILFCEADGMEYFWEYLLKIEDFRPVNMSEMYHDANLILIRSNSTTNVDTYPNISSTVKLYEKEVVTFQCVFWEAFLKGDVEWTITYVDGNQSVWKAYSRNVEEGRVFVEEETIGGEETTVAKQFVAISNATIQGKHGIVSLTCQVEYWNGLNSASASKNINILTSTSPVFEQNVTFLTATVGSLLELHCSSDSADPSPIYTWTFPETDSFKISPPGGEYSNLTFRIFPKHAAGLYICRATNFGGEAEKHFHVTIITNIEIWEYILGGVGVMFLILIIVFAGLLRRYYLQKGKLTELEIRYFYKGDTNALQTDGLAHENAEYMPFRDEYKVKWKDFRISTDKLGSGAFGVVYKGCLNQDENSHVAVKTVKPGIEKAMLLSLLSEIKVMVYIGKHENIVELVGACTDFLRDGRVYMLVELCALGSLESFLRTNASKYSSTRMPDSEYLDLTGEVTPGENYLIGTKDMINWSKQIACGMCYLMEKKVIHGDLATRNVLLMNKYQAKITDFGLSHHLINYQTYAKKSDGPLPWRWMALETLKTFAFSPKSDVWAFGVTLWEIFSLGQIPYPGIKWTHEFVGFLEEGLRLSQPKRASDSIYKIMKMCWNADPEIRPDFQFLQQCMTACEDSHQTAEA